MSLSMINPSSNPNGRKYFSVSISDEYEELGPIPKWVNREELAKRNRNPVDSSKPFGNFDYAAAPQYRFDRTGRPDLTFHDVYGVKSRTWMVANRLKQLLEQVDSEGFAFQKVDSDYSNFSEPGPDYWFMYPVRELDCIDEEKSKIRYQDNILPKKNYLALVEVKMIPERIGSAHAFRLKYAIMDFIVDDIIVDLLQANHIIGFEYEPLKVSES